MRWLLALAILLFSTQASAAIAFSVGGGCGASPGAECTVTLAIPNNGTVVVSVASNTANQSIVRLVDTARNNYNLLKDRKSTRLNSSHVSISYAVFCLKKKKKKIQKT